MDVHFQKQIGGTLGFRGFLLIMNVLFETVSSPKGVYSTLGQKITPVPWTWVVRIRHCSAACRLSPPEG